ncbi:uncharacterized protein LOC119743242 [Patiria miniata]|uniref:Septin-type G domain-containing protein n=1 Tax=Patiria miniata TaxID=46514 RepID=A0A914BHK6_PATMI|nr:uncharacterized protein LOC119743242 [Patiria miniata]
MVVGATGTGKSTLINMMINYILGVKWEDNVRFKLVEERGSRSQAYSQTQNITSYTIHNNDHINLSYTLTLIDTPGFGDTAGIERDKANVDKIKDFFSNSTAHGVDHIDAVGFVVQSSQPRLTPAQKYVFDSILSVFGKDIEANIMMLITFCDGSRPVVLDAVTEANLPFGNTFKFNNSVLFASQNQFGIGYWEMGYTSMHEFVCVLDGLQPQSLTLTVEVLRERKRLEIALQGLQEKIQFAHEQTEHFENMKQLFKEHEQEIEANKSFIFKGTVAKLEKIPNQTSGSTNCTQCRFTCHHPCTYSQAKFLCRAMTWMGYCTVCPDKCSSGVHVHEYFRYNWKMVNEVQTYDDFEKQCRSAKGRKQTFEEVLKKVEADRDDAETAVHELIRESHKCTQRLEEIALKPNPMGIIEYIDMMIETEKATKTPGWEKKVGYLEATKRRENAKDVIAEAPDTSRNAVARLYNKLKHKLGFSGAA